MAYATPLVPARPRPTEEHRPWWEGTRGMGALAPTFLEDRIQRALAARTIEWLFDPHPKQVEILTAGERFLVAACGRRFGKTMIALRWLAEQANATQSLTWWVAPTYATAMRAWGDVIKYLPRKYRSIVKSERRIELTGGGAIEFHSADNPDALRGAGLAAAVLDEAAYTPDYVYHDVISPMLLTTQGRVLAISSPRAKKGWFYELFRSGQQGEPDCRSWQLPTSCNPYVPIEEIERLRRSLPDATFRREVLAEFADELSSVFPSVKDVATLARQAVVLPAQYVVGVDWGRRNDYTVIAVLRDLGDGRAAMADLVRFTGLRYEAQLDQLREVVARYRPTQILAEENSMGGPLVERLQDEGLPIAGFATTSTTKTPLVQQLQLGIEHHALGLLADPVLVNEFEDYEEELLPSGHRAFNAPERQHDDTVIGTALAWRLIVGEPGEGRGGHFSGDPSSYRVDGVIVPALPRTWNPDPLLRLCA